MKAVKTYFYIEDDGIKTEISRCNQLLRKFLIIYSLILRKKNMCVIGVCVGADMI